MISQDLGLHQGSHLTAPRHSYHPGEAEPSPTQATVSARNSEALASEVAVAVYRPEVKRPAGDPTDGSGGLALP